MSRRHGDHANINQASHSNGGNHVNPPLQQRRTRQNGSHDLAPSALTVEPRHGSSPFGSHGQYFDDVCDSPVSSSEESMHNHVLETSQTSRQEYLPNTAEPTAEGLSRLSLDHGMTDERSFTARASPGRGRCHDESVPPIASKRAASSDLARPQAAQTPPGGSSSAQDPTRRSKLRQKRGFHGPHYHSNSGSANEYQARRNDYGQVPRDSGYESAFPSRQHTQATLLPPTRGSTIIEKRLPDPVPEHDTRSMDPQRDAHISKGKRDRFPGLILQPDSSPISQDQLAAEVKGIYAGLVMVEAKCINIDAAQAADPKSYLGPEQWQALIALHRTLLYEHHDFLMATQHPSATQALRGLATKYSMPARMWKHGIHAFLEVLRHRRPDSQDYMLAFIYLAYQMMALLFETVPSFTDTWIECLGDLARYRMAIEEEKEAHATWGGVAARWYTMASDRHPAIGRLYHHLGILERPSLRKFCFYAKSLTCVIPFPNARDSLSTLCGPIVQDDQTIQSSRQSAEARIVTFHALIYTVRDQSLIDEVGRDALNLLGQQLNKLRDFGAYLAVTNVAALFELGSPTNMLWQMYTAAINQAMQSSRPSLASTTGQTEDVLSKLLPNTGLSVLLSSSMNFFVDSFDFVLRQYNDPELMKNCLGFVHITLVWFHSLHNLRTRLNNDNHHTFNLPIDLGRISWGVLAEFLNTLASLDPVSAYVLECARQGNFLGTERNEDARPLSEDYTIRGLVWGQFYFSPGWFDGQCEDDGRAIETDAMAQSRIERVLWLGLYLAFHTEFLHYDVQKKVFSASHLGQTLPKAQSAHPAAVVPADLEMEQVSEVVALSPRSRSSGTHSTSSSGSSEDGFQKVKRPRTTRSPPRYTYANVAAAPLPRPKKARKDFNNFRVVDENYAEWSAH